ncbi:MAG: hypothetical protein J1E40_07430, partial [Oscillospiraceae bacterium]|nr:hypothetical protein [Oscillospiraceae bacterium]
VDICSVANSRNTLGYKNSVALAGRGSEAIGVAQVRDRIRDKQVRDYSGDLCNVGVKVGVLSDIEDLFDSIEADSGYADAASLTSILSKLKSALQSFSADNADRTEMANIVINAARSLVQSVNNTNGKIDDVCNQTMVDTKQTVDRINAIFGEMAELNKQIKNAYISMGYITRTNNNYEVMKEYGPLELKDEMHSLLDELSQYGNIDYEEMDDGTFTVKFGNQLVVEQDKYAQMAMAEESPRPTELAFIITQVERDTDGKIIGGLYKKDEWFDMHVKNRTGGDAQLLVRKSVREPIGMYNETVKTFDFSGKRPNNTLYLDSGSLRGYLDVYNGRGLYADNILGDAVGTGLTDNYQYICQQVDLANKALDDLAALDLTDPNNMEMFYKIVDVLEDSVGAKFDMDPDTGDYTIPPVIKVNGVTIFENGTATKLSVENPDAPAKLGNAQIKAGNDIVRTIAINDYNGIEFYRDMLNAFVKTITKAFNDIYKDIDVKVPNPDYPDNSDEEFIYEKKSFELFTYDDGYYAENDPSMRTFRRASGSFRVAQDWIDNPMLIANPTNDNQYEELNNIFINKLLGLFSEDAAEKFTFSDDFGHAETTQHTLEKYIAHISENVGNQVASEGYIYTVTDIALTTAEEERSGVMDVSMNEEGISMMNYQKWYNAISRMISTLDEALDKLINQTGLVGLR